MVISDLNDPRALCLPRKYFATVDLKLLSQIVMFNGNSHPRPIFSAGHKYSFTKKSSNGLESDGILRANFYVTHDHAMNDSMIT